MKNIIEKRSQANLLRYISNLLLAAIVGLLISFYIIVPLIQVNQVIHPIRHELCCIIPSDIGLKYEEVSFSTKDQIVLSGWYIPSKNRAIIIILHGAGGNRLNGLNHANMLAQHGYGVLLFDLRANGNSEGDTFAFGWESEDIFAALEYLQNRSEVDKDRIGGLGLSAGGQTLLQAAVESEQIQAVVSDGAGAHTLKDALSMRSWYLSPGVWVYYTAGELLSGVPSPPPLRESIHRISPRPVMLISAENGSFGEKISNKIYYEAALEPKIFWEIPDTNHTNGILSKPEEYESKVVEFFNSALLNK